MCYCLQIVQTLDRAHLGTNQESTLLRLGIGIVFHQETRFASAGTGLFSWINWFWECFVQGSGAYTFQCQAIHFDQFPSTNVPPDFARIDRYEFVVEQAQGLEFRAIVPEDLADADRSLLQFLDIAASQKINLDRWALLNCGLKYTWTLLEKVRLFRSDGKISYLHDFKF